MADLINTGAKLETPEQVYARLNKSLTDTKISEESMIPQDVAQVDNYLTKAEQSLDVLAESNKAFIAGELPKDVQDRIVQTNKEMAAMAGMGVGTMSGKRTLRDIGVSSLGMIEKGQQNQAVIAEGYKGLAGVKETMRQFNSSFAQNAQQLLDASRKTNLAATASGLEYSQFRANLTNEINQQITALTSFREDLLYKYTATDKIDSFEGSAATIDNVINQLNKILGA